MAEELMDVRVLLAEEQSLFRESIRMALEAEPDLRVVAVADSGVRAVAEAERHLPDVAVLSDGLTGLDGIQATYMIRERVPGCRVLFLASNEDQTNLMAALEAGAIGYLAKSCRLSELVGATRAIHRGETLVPPTMLGDLLARLMALRQDRDRSLRMVSRLTSREREVLALLAAGGNNQTIAEALVISPDTARTHVQHVLGKLGVHSRLAAAAFARQNGILEYLQVFG
ncbi:MAG: response regulator transcription factor [Actinomycetota bacterium]|nr:response regulator transcription factor [Actinomycetota bacterium]